MAAPDEELTDNPARILFKEASKGLDLSKPEVASGLKVVLTETTQMASASTGALGNRSRKKDTPKVLAIGCGDVLTS